MTDTDTGTSPDSGMSAGAGPVRPLAPLWGWLGVWIAAGLVVLVTLVAFLLGIVGDLEAIDVSLAEASAAVGGAAGHTKPLPGYIADVNTTLVAIDRSLEPVPGTTHDISRSLVGMRGNLERVDGSLRTTSGSLSRTAGALTATAGSLSDTARALIGTSSSLVDTSSVLRSLSASLADTSNLLDNVGSVGGRILDTLRHTQANPDQLGTENLWKRADVTLAVRAAAEHDTADVLGGVTDVNRHLKSICNRVAAPPSC